MYLFSQTGFKKSLGEQIVQEVVLPNAHILANNQTYNKFKKSWHGLLLGTDR